MSITENNICIIPARGGSKRIPKKNIKSFLGMPIIVYSIKAALNSSLFKEVMVSTDDHEIAEIAICNGAKVPFMRSCENSDDYASTISVIKEVISKYELEGKEFHNICCIYPTAPFVDASVLYKSYSLFKDGSFDSLFPVIRFDYPIQRALVLRNGKYIYNESQYANTRSQDLEDMYHDAGQFYWLTHKMLSSSDSIITENTGALVISGLHGQDIDTFVDWKLAEIKYELLQSIK